MAFWSSQTLGGRLDELLDDPASARIDCNALELRVGREIYVTPNLDDIYTTTKRQLAADEPFQIPPGQFAFLLTEEAVSVPAAAMAFISMKATFKMKGLINVSGFHVDPGWNGQLVFAVFNAGPSPVHLQRGLRLFLIWYADLDAASASHKTVHGANTISPAIINNLTGGNDSLYALDQRLKDSIKDLEKADDDLSDRLHSLNSKQTGMIVTFSVLTTILLGLIGFVTREAIRSWIPSVATKSVEGRSAQPASGPLNQTPGK